MPFNTDGIQAVLQAGEAVTMFLAIGDGATAGDQTSNERVEITYDAVAGVLVGDAPYEFTGSAGAGATNGLFFSAVSAGTFYGAEAISGDQTFNANGEYTVDTLAVTGSST